MHVPKESFEGQETRSIESIIESLSVSTENCCYIMTLRSEINRKFIFAQSGATYMRNCRFFTGTGKVSDMKHWRTAKQTLVMLIRIPTGNNTIHYPRCPSVLPLATSSLGAKSCDGGLKGFITFVLSSTTRRPSADTHNTARTGFFPACRRDTKGTEMSEEHRNTAVFPVNEEAADKRGERTHVLRCCSECGVTQ